MLVESTRASSSRARLLLMAAFLLGARRLVVSGSPPVALPACSDPAFSFALIERFYLRIHYLAHPGCGHDRLHPLRQPVHLASP
jgi:hypothetical protein